MKYSMTGQEKGDWLIEVTARAGSTVLRLWKESLNCDGQQFYQYEQNEHLPLTSNRWT